MFLRLGGTLLRKAEFFFARFPFAAKMTSVHRIYLGSYFFNEIVRVAPSPKARFEVVDILTERFREGICF